MRMCDTFAKVKFKERKTERKKKKITPAIQVRNEKKNNNNNNKFEMKIYSHINAK